MDETGVMHMSLCAPTSTHPTPYIKFEQLVKGKREEKKNKKLLQVAMKENSASQED